MKILLGAIEPTSGEVYIDKNQRISTLEQDHFKYNDYIVTDFVIKGNEVLSKIKEEKDAIYMNPNSDEKDDSRAADLAELFGQLGGWNAENDAKRF